MSKIMKKYPEEWLSLGVRWIQDWEKAHGSFKYIGNILVPILMASS